MVEVIPVFRIFDYDKTLEFYIDWLGFSVDWEHKFHENSPVYMQVSKDGIVLHLTEHHGDCSPGSKAFIRINDVKSFHSEICSKKYKYNNPGLELAPWNALCMELIDPFNNKLLITENSPGK